MRKVFERNEKLGIFEELVFDHFYNEDIDMIERGDVNSRFIEFCFGLLIIFGLALAA